MDTEVESPEVESKAKVLIPEEFQKEATELVDSCDSEECMDFLRNLCQDRCEELRRKRFEAESKKGKGKKVAQEYNLSEMPYSD